MHEQLSTNAENDQVIKKGKILAILNGSPDYIRSFVESVVLLTNLELNCYPCEKDENGQEGLAIYHLGDSASRNNAMGSLIYHMVFHPKEISKREFFSEHQADEYSTSS